MLLGDLFLSSRANNSIRAAGEMRRNLQSRREKYPDTTSPIIKTTLLVALCIVMGHGADSRAAARQAAIPQSEDRAYARRGIDLMMDGDLDAAIQIFREVQLTDTKSPLGYVLEAQATWWKIYFATADLLDPDVFDVARQDVSPLDYHFSDLTNATIRLSEARIHADQDVARNVLYEGMAYGLQARLSGMRGKDLSTTRAGKKMRALLLSALKLDPRLTDAYLGLGTYNYFIDTLPPAIKILRVLGNVPGGNRELGMQQIQQASEKGDLVRGEAKFFLAKNYSRESEKKYGQSLELFRELARDYPHNPLWMLLSADMQLHSGNTSEGDALLREVIKNTQGKNLEWDQAVHRTAEKALAGRK